MHNIFYLYFIDILLIAMFIYACARKDRTDNTYVEMPDEYYHSEIITAERMYNDDDQDYEEL
jgi:hypothetical protein